MRGAGVGDEKRWKEKNVSRRIIKSATSERERSRPGKIDKSGEGAEQARWLAP